MSGPLIMPLLKQSRVAEKAITARERERKSHWWLKIVTAGVATFALVSLGLSHYRYGFIRDTPSTPAPSVQFSATPATTTTGKLEDCLAHDGPKPASPPAPCNPWAYLKQHETAEIQAWLESNPPGLNLNLNLTKASQAVISDNAVYNIETFYPPKEETLAYLDDPENLERPRKYARVTIHHGGEEVPCVRDYVVGPLPLRVGNGSHGRSRGSGRVGDGEGENRWREVDVRPLKEIYHRPVIPYNARGLGDLVEAFRFMEGVVEPIREVMKDLFGGIWDGENDTFTAGPGGPWSYDGSFRRAWVTWRYNVAGSFLVPINFYNYVEMSGTDPSLWKILRIVYHDQIFPSTESFLEAYRNGSLIRHPPPIPTQKESEVKRQLEWTSRKRTGKPRDLDHRPGPRAVSFAGPRFRVDRELQYVSWMGWGVYLGFDRDMGMSLWDGRFRGERVFYQLAPQEAIAQYAGADPIQSSTAWLDRYFGMGILVRNLIPHYDCPHEAVFLPAETFHAAMGGHIRRDRAICVFEMDTGKPITRHVGDVEGEMGAVKGYVLVVRSVSTVGNYDYLFDYIFHLDGTIEVKVAASGYLQGGYWTEKQRDYGYNLSKFSMGNMHDHVINFKVDLDIAGTSNSLLKTTMAQEEVTLPWADDDWGNTVIQQRVTREYVATEDDSRVQYATNFQGVYAIVNKDRLNKWGNPRGYAIQPGLSPIRNTVVGSKRLEHNANWAKYNLAVTRRKETEPSSSCMWNLHLSGAPVVDFDRFFDGEGLDQEDLVVWVNVGTHHLPHAEDSPNTKTNIATSGFMLTPYNYFDSDPSMESMNAIILHPPKPGSTTTPGEAFDFHDYGVKQDFHCVPRPPPPFRYDAERPVFGLQEESGGGDVGEDGIDGGYDKARMGAAYGKIRSVLHPLRIRVGI